MHVFEGFGLSANDLYGSWRYSINGGDDEIIDADTFSWTRYYKATEITVKTFFYD